MKTPNDTESLTAPTTSGGELDCPDLAGSVTVPRRLLENLLDNTRQLCADNHWWKDEPRMDYQANYAQLQDEIKQAEAILSQNDQSMPPADE